MTKKSKIIAGITVSVILIMFVSTIIFPWDSYGFRDQNNKMHMSKIPVFVGEVLRYTHNIGTLAEYEQRYEAHLISRIQYYDTIINPGLDKASAIALRQICLDELNRLHGRAVVKPVLPKPVKPIDPLGKPRGAKLEVRK